MLTLVNHESSEGRILAAAQRVLRREGAGGLTMRAVATEAGLTATAIYRHYQDKAALLKRIIREEYNLFLSYVTAVKPGLGPGDQFVPRATATSTSPSNIRSRINCFLSSRMGSRSIAIRRIFKRVDLAASGNFAHLSSRAWKPARSATATRQTSPSIFMLTCTAWSCFTRRVASTAGTL